MFTVIICSSEFINNLQNHYSYIIDVVSKSEKCAFCTWNTHATTLEAALPELQYIISGKPMWRAVVVQDSLTFGMDCIDKRNPFDAVGAINVIQDFNESRIFNKLDELLAFEKSGTKIEPEKWADLDEQIQISNNLIKEYRKKKKENYSAAVSNPLTRLGIWLTGITDKQPSVLPGIPEYLFDDSVEIDRNYYLSLLKAGVLVSEIEQYHILRYKYETLVSNFDKDSMIVKKPEQILVLSERINTHADDSFYSKQGDYEEIEYSNFCDDNLYCGRMRFVFSDIQIENNVRNTKDYLTFVSSMVTFAEHEMPDNTVRSQRVYKAETIIDDEKIISFYSKYLSKLYKTKKLLLASQKKYIDDCEKKDVSAEEASGTFESDVHIPVIIQTEYSKNELLAKYNKIGLSKDCPVDEYHYWYNQIREITKKFIRYLREPRRSVQVAVKNDFRKNNTISSKRARNLTDFQLEDIQYHLIEEEQKMIETKTETIFKTKEYTDKLDKADKEIRRGISQRMTKKKTVIVGLIAVAAYFIGFIPLIFGNLNTISSFVFSLAITGIILGIFLIIGFIYLFKLRKKLINRFKHFNYVMSGILRDIENALDEFAVYLSHTCNVMREFSVFKWLNKKEDINLNILKKHIRDIECKTKEIEEMFVSDYNTRIDDFSDELPYTYDFTVARDYSYDIPYEDAETIIEYVIKGNQIKSSIGYIESVTLTREELYD